MTVSVGGRYLLPYTKPVGKKCAGRVCRTMASGPAPLRRATLIYAYMRVSTPQQNLENQHYALLKFADQRAWRIDRWVTETGSGAKPATERLLGQLLDQLTAQDIWLVTDLSRLGRRLMEIRLPLRIREILYCSMSKE